MRRGTSRFWYWAVVLVALGGTAYLLVEMVRGPTWALMIDLTVVLVALVLLARAHPKTMRHGCPACGARQDPVRSTDGRRLWTCRGCGWERTRLRSRKELGESRSPRSIAAFDDATNPGSRLTR